MEIFRPQVPEGCELIGFVYRDKDFSILGEDMAECQLPSGVLVCIGWYPEGSRSGCYKVTATLGLENVDEPYLSPEPLKACDVFEIYCEKWKALNET